MNAHSTLAVIAVIFVEMTVPPLAAPGATRPAATSCWSRRVRRAPSRSGSAALSLRTTAHSLHVKCGTSYVISMKYEVWISCCHISSSIPDSLRDTEIWYRGVGSSEYLSSTTAFSTSEHGTSHRIHKRISASVSEMRMRPNPTSCVMLNSVLIIVWRLYREP